MTLQNLKRKKINIKNLARRAVKDEKIIKELMENLLLKEETVRFNSYKILHYISEAQPKVLYPHWDFFAEMLADDNTYHKYIAINVLANLTSVDNKNKFEKIFGKYYGLLTDESIIPASQVAVNSGKIAKALPKLQNKITNKLLRIKKMAKATSRNRNIDLLKSSVVQSFAEYFEKVKDKKKIIGFVKEQLNSKSPKTRKVAKEFLERWK
jgi:hypothetical protein